MPDNQNENKFMAMLERRGIVRKTGSEEEEVEPELVAERSQPEADLRSLFSTSAIDAPKVTPASRQPVPGFSTPIMPSERQQAVQEQEQQPQQPAGRIEHERTQPPMDREESKPYTPAEERAAYVKPESPPERTPDEKPKATEAQKPLPFFNNNETIRDASFRTETPRPAPAYTATQGSASASATPAAAPAPVIPSATVAPYTAGPAVPAPYEPPAPPSPPPAESYTDRYLEINELYEVLSLRSKRTDTIYLVEEYLRSIPDSLPDDSRREIVSRIVAASGFDYDLLTGDGVLRVKMLKDYAEKFARHTDDYIAARNAELAELEQQSVRVRKLIENRRELHKKQFYTIEAEAQRLKEILTFISG